MPTIETTAIETRAVAKIRREVGGLGDTARELVVDNEDTARNATGLLVFVANAKRKLEEQRVFLVKPLNDHVKNINAKFKEWVQPLDVADRVVRGKMLDFQKLQEALRAEAQLEQERLAEVPEGFDDLPEDLPVVAPRLIRGDTGSTSMKKTWTFEVTDEALVPRKYLMLDEGVINLAVRGGERDIPGIRIYQQESLSVRT